MRPTAKILLTLLSLVSAAALAFPAQSAVDSDHDGLSDAEEQALLRQFAPALQADPHDCAGEPAFFEPGGQNPIAASEDGTLYAQATPRTLPGIAGPLVELRYFHLWRIDCGRMGHPLDTEHVSVLVQAGAQDSDSWHALYWYAAAHEDTVCDASQIARASTLGAETGGAQIWISQGKHASFLHRELCRRGCGGDDCTRAHPLAVPRIVNLGEPAHPMNGATWAASAEWPLEGKLERTDFDPALLARLERLPATDIAWVYPAKRPAQATIAAGGVTADALAMSNRKTDTALSLASNDTGNALDTSYGKVVRSLQKSAHGVSRFLHGDLGKPRPQAAAPSGKPASGTQ
ncbi:MAG TPA: hypothetical protein VG893_08435 [Terracidiphilus sp.]|nr:hypothetical protein [Terracidiphilus sp.]